MNVRLYTYIFFLLIAAYSLSANNHSSCRTITPNDFTGSDTERIQAAINAARKTPCKIVIPQGNSNGSNNWKIDR